MISNERPSPYGRPYNSGKIHKQPTVQEDTLESGKLQIERKTFVFTLKENPRGRFLRITEYVNGRRDSIIIPATGLTDFREQLDLIIRAHGERPEEGIEGQPASDD